MRFFNSNRQCLNIDIFLVTKAFAVERVNGLQMENKYVLLFEVAKTLFDV